MIEPAIGEGAANDILVTLATAGYGISKLGTNFQVALETDPYMALAGMAVGMIEASLLSAFLDIATVYVGSRFALFNQYGANLSIDPGWWRDLIGTDNPNPAFQAGRGIGQFGMEVSDIVVGIRSVPHGTARGGSVSVIQDGNALLAVANGAMTLTTAQALGLLGGGYAVTYLAIKASDDDGGGNEADDDQKDTKGSNYYGDRWHKYKRTPEQYEDLARDYGHNRQINRQGLYERDVILDMEDRGLIEGPVTRHPHPAAEYDDFEGRVWDIKTFDPHHGKTGYDFEKAMTDITGELGLGENLILDIRHFDDFPTELNELQRWITQRGFDLGPNPRIKYYRP